MDAATTTFSLGFDETNNKVGNNKKGPKPVKKSPDFLVLTPEDGEPARFTLSQLWSYSEKMPKAFEKFQECGNGTSARYIIENLKKAKDFFTGVKPIKTIRDKATKTTTPVKIEVLTADEFDALFEEFDAEVSKETDPKKIEEDAERDQKQRELGVALFRNLLCNEERVKKMMLLFEGVVDGGAATKGPLWTIYLGFLKFILVGVAEDYKDTPRNEDGSFDLEHPHLSFSSLSTAIYAAKINLKANNTMCEVEVGGRQRSGSTASRSSSFHGRRPSFGRANSFVTKTSPHDFASALKWCLVLGLIEKTFTPALYEKLKAMKSKAYIWCAYNIGVMLQPFNIEPLGEVPAKPESKKDADAKKETDDDAESVVSADAEPAQEEAVVDSDEEESDDEEEEKKPEEAEDDSDDDEEEDDDEEDDD